MEKGFILVGFGKEQLTDLVEKIGNPEEEKYLVELLEERATPVWRADEQCEKKQIDAFFKYVDWIKSLESEMK